MNKKTAFKCTKESIKFHTYPGFDLWGRPHKGQKYPQKIEKRYPSIKKRSNYAVQLNAKQFYRTFYGNLSEGYFQKLFRNQKTYQVKQNALTILESRLDTVMYRIGFATTPLEAQQLVVHGHVNVNGKRVQTPSIILKVGDFIEIREKSKPFVFSKLYERISKKRGIPYPVNHIEIAYDFLNAVIVSKPDINNCMYFTDPEYISFYDMKWVIQYYNR